MTDLDEMLDPMSANVTNPGKGAEEVEITSEEFTSGFGERITDTLNLETWSTGENLGEIYGRIAAEVRDAVELEEEVRKTIRKELFPTLGAYKGAPKELVFSQPILRISSASTAVFFSMVELRLVTEPNRSMIRCHSRSSKLGLALCRIRDIKVLGVIDSSVVIYAFLGVIQQRKCSSSWKAGKDAGDSTSLVDATTSLS